MNVRYADTRTFTPLGVIIQRMRIRCARASKIKIRAWPAREEARWKKCSYPKGGSHANSKGISELTGKSQKLGS